MSVFRLPASVSGPTGDTDSALGLPAIIVTTSWSRLLLSFLSMPASLPGEEEWKQGKEGHRVRKAVETRASVETFFRLNN